MIKERSIRSKLIRLILTISNLSLLVAFSVLYTYEIISYRETITRQLKVQGSMLAENATAALAFGDSEEALMLLRSLANEPNIAATALYHQDSTLFVHDAFGNHGSAVPDKLAYDRNQRSSEYFEIVLPVTQGNKLLGWLYIKRSSKDVNEKIKVYLFLVLAVLLICFALTYILSRSFERSISTPIIELADTARAISEKHDYSVRATTYADGELNTLTTAFNVMLSRIDEQNQQIQRHAQELETKVQERTLDIKRQKDFAETIINSSLVLIAVFDNETRFIAFNKRCEIEFGMRREDVLGKRFAEVMPSVVGSPGYKAVIRALNGEVVHYEQYRSPVSNEYYENFGIPLYNEQNEVYAAILTAHNITATVTANEKVLRSNEELKKKNADLEQFAYVASHDLQEPLRKIQIFTDRALRDLTALNMDVGYLQKIEASAQRMSRLITDVLEYSRLSKLEESFIETDLNLILDYVKADFELLITEKNATIESDELPMIMGNKLQLHQLFANLISNALKFNDHAPHISIRLDAIALGELDELALNRNRKYFKLLISDNGIGFDPQFATKLFTIFQRLNPRDKYEGTGIGLALCKKIVDNHSGYITVTSTPGQGTRFTVILPLN